jgi:hypothetical protein
LVFDPFGSKSAKKILQDENARRDVTIEEFRELFQRALNIAADNAEANLPKSIPRSFLVALHSFGYDDKLLSVDEAVDKMYLGNDRFYRIIDVAVIEVSLNDSVVFVRVSGHAPGPLGATWDPTGSGPFKQLIAEKIVDRRVNCK